MKKFTYANEYTVVGNIVDENEMTYIVEFEAAPGFMDTVTFEKELTTVEEIKEIKENEEVTVVDELKNRVYKGTVVKGNKYEYIIFQSELSEVTIEVKKLEKLPNGKKTSVMYWDINKETLKGSGGLSKKVMDVVEKLR